MRTIELDKVDISITDDTAEKVVHQMDVDNIFDAVQVSINNNNILRSSVFERMCDDYKDELSELLRKFWDRKSDACPLEATEHENQIEEWQDWIDNGM